jgi:hypothetical protein
MQHRAAHAQAVSLRKAGGHRVGVIPETDSMKRRRLVSRQMDSEFRKGGQSIRQYAFSAGFIDRRPGRIGEDHREPAAARGHGCG